MFGLLTCSSSQSIGQLSYTCFAMSEAESLGENRNSFVFPLTKMRRKFIISAGTLLDILPIYTRCSRKKKKIQQTKRSKSLQATQKSALTILISSRCAFPKLSDFRAKVPARPRFCADRSGPRELCGRGGGHSGRAAPSSSSSAAAAVAASGPAAPGGPSRVTHGHGAVGGG